MRPLVLGVAVLAVAATPALAPSPATAANVITFDQPKRHNSLVVFARPEIRVSLAPGASDLRIWLNGDLVTSRFRRAGDTWIARIGRGDGLRLGENTLSVGVDDASGERRSATRVFRAVRQDPTTALVGSPRAGQQVATSPMLTVVRTRANLSEFRVWLNLREVTGLFGSPRPARARGYVVRRARIPSARGLRPGGNVLKVRAVTRDFRHRTVFRTFQASAATAS